MCEYSNKLIAWLDHELPDDEAAGVERHLQTCAECRGQVGSYEEVSSAFAAYCQRAAVPIKRRRPPVLASLGISAGVAASVALWFALRPAAVPQLPLHPPPVASAPAMAFQATPAAPWVVHRRPAAPPAATQEAAWRPSEPAIQIAIPAEAMFPPGAVPAGFSFIADVSIAADGSPQALRVLP